MRTGFTMDEPLFDSRGTQLDGDLVVDVGKTDQEKDLLLAYVACLEIYKVSHEVAMSFANDVATGLLTPEMAARLANERLMEPLQRINSGGQRFVTQAVEYAHNNGMANIAMQQFAVVAADRINSKAGSTIQSHAYESDSTKVMSAIIDRDEAFRELGQYVDDKRLAGVKECFDIAEKWGTKENLTQTEACHGVAWEMQKRYGDTYRLREENVEPGVEYATLYDDLKADAVKAKLAKSAADLFD